MPECPKEKATTSEKNVRTTLRNYGSDVSHLLKYTKEYYFTRIPVKFYACANDRYHQALISLPARTVRVKGPGYKAGVHVNPPFVLNFIEPGSSDN